MFYLEMVELVMKYLRYGILMEPVLEDKYGKDVHDYYEDKKRSYIIFQNLRFNNKVPSDHLASGLPSIGMNNEYIKYCNNIM